MSGGLISNDGKRILIDRAYNVVPTRTAPQKFKVGTGTSTPTVTQTGLDHPIPISGTLLVDSCDVTTGWTDSADMTVSVNTTTFKEGIASLDLTKDGTGSANASTDKTTTSRDLTSKELSLWLYIIDATMLSKLAVTACVTIRFGSDSSNYYQWTKDRSFFSVGWNLIDGLTSATATVTGSPAIAACDYTFVQITAGAAGTVWVAGDMAMDDIKVVGSTNYLKSFEATYPSMDYNLLQVTIRSRLSTVEANGYLIGEFGQFNTDGTPLMESRDTFTPLSKSDTDELIFETKTLIG